MPRYEYEDDDRPRSRRRRDDNDDYDYDDRPRRRRQDLDEDDDDYDDRPRSRSRRRDEDDDYDDRPRRKKAGNGPAAVSLTLGLLAFLLNAITGIPAIIFGVLGLKKAGPYGPGRGMAMSGIGCGIAGMILSGFGYYFAWKGVSTAQTQARVTNNAKHIGIAMHNFHDVGNGFPQAYTTSPAAPRIPDQPVPADQRLMSWRTSILPYIEQDNLFRQYDANQPWNSARNLPATSQVVTSFLNDPERTNETRFRVFTGRNTAFRHGMGRMNFGRFTDGTSNTLLVVESAESGPWAEPRDLELPPAGLPALGNPTRPTFLVLMADGSVRSVSKAVSERTMRLLIDPADGNPIPPGDF